PDHGSGAVQSIPADAVLLTQPVPEARRLLDGSGVELPEAVHDDLGRIRYARGLALLAAFAGPSHTPPGGIVSFSDSPLAWLVDNHRLGASALGTALTALADPAWAAEHWGEPDDAIAEKLLRLVGEWAGGECLWHRLRRWEHHTPVVARVRMPFAQVLDD